MVDLIEKLGMGSLPIFRTSDFCTFPDVDEHGNARIYTNLPVYQRAEISVHDFRRMVYVAGIAKRNDNELGCLVTSEKALLKTGKLFLHKSAWDKDPSFDLYDLKNILDYMPIKRDL